MASALDVTSTDVDFAGLNSLFVGCHFLFLLPNLFCFLVFFWEIIKALIVNYRVLFKRKETTEA